MCSNDIAEVPVRRYPVCPVSCLHVHRRLCSQHVIHVQCLDIPVSALLRSHLLPANELKRSQQQTQNLLIFCRGHTAS